MTSQETYGGGLSGHPGGPPPFRCVLTLLLLLLCGCAAPHSAPSDSPADPSWWLEGGEQSRITPRLSSMAARLGGRTQLETVRRIMHHVWYYHYYDSRKIDGVLLSTADQLVDAPGLGGCSDFALLHAALFRAAGLPARLVVTADDSWLREFRADGFGTTKGHTFVEVWADRRWYLVDPAWGWLIADYDPDWTCYPRAQVFFARARTSGTWACMTLRTSTGSCASSPCVTPGVAGRRCSPCCGGPRTVSGTDAACPRPGRIAFNRGFFTTAGLYLGTFRAYIEGCPGVAIQAGSRSARQIGTGPIFAPTRADPRGRT